MSEVRGWLIGRRPRPPEALPLPIEDGAGDVLDELTESGLAALERALAGRGERSGAFELLAADALLTYACERAAVSADPDRELRRILERTSRRSG